MRVFHHAGLLVNGPPGTAGRVALQLVIRQLQLSRAGQQTSARLYWAGLLYCSTLGKQASALAATRPRLGCLTVQRRDRHAPSTAGFRIHQGAVATARPVRSAWQTETALASGLISVNARERSCCAGRHLDYGRVLRLRVSSPLHGFHNRVGEQLQSDGAPPLRGAPLHSDGVHSPGASVSS
jgi:hypothetical protein